MPAGKAIELRDIVYLEDIDTVVVVRTRVSKENAGQVAQLFLQAHRVAHTYLEQHGRGAPVHCHTIEEGRIDIEPQLYMSLDQLNRESRKR